MTARRGLSGEQRLIVGSLTALAGLAWARTVHDAQGMSCIMMMPAMHGPWWVGCPLYMAAWAVMMAAMMLPAAAPLVLMFARVAQSRAGTPAFASPWLFVSGYALTWSALGIPAYFGTLGLQTLAAHHPALAAAGPKWAAATLLLAGLYQWTPAKDACLRHCRSPLHFVLHGWRDGRLGAVRMGATHGAFCVGCCIGLMAVLFAVGIMNLLWMAIVAAAMTVEKLLPGGRFISRVSGALLVLLGLGGLFLPALSQRLF